MTTDVGATSTPSIVMLPRIIGSAVYEAWIIVEDRVLWKTRKVLELVGWEKTHLLFGIPWRV